VVEFHCQNKIHNTKRKQYTTHSTQHTTQHNTTHKAQTHTMQSTTTNTNKRSIANPNVVTTHRHTTHNHTDTHTTTNTQTHKHTNTQTLWQCEPPHLIDPPHIAFLVGAEVCWKTFNPFALLVFLMLNCLAFASCIEARLAVHPSTHTTPWRIIIYCDEAAPGNLLRVDNTRKLQAFYWSFAEFGHKLLCKEHVWFLGGVLRSTLAGSISGGMSCVFRHLLKCFFGLSKTSMIALPLLGQFRFQTTQPAHVPAQRPPGPLR
jgi:hypothetical protein